MDRPQKLSESELNTLVASFADVTNYEAEDPLTPIDPITYIAPDNDTCLHIAARRGDLHSIKLLLKAGLDINACGDMGTTPLHCAKIKEVVDYLIEHGASLDIRDEFGRLPLEVNREN